MSRVESRTARRAAAIAAIQKEQAIFIEMTGQIGPSPVLHASALLEHVVLALEAGATVKDLKPLAQPIKITVDQGNRKI